MLLNKNDLNQALEILASHASVYVPGEADNVKRFVLWEKDMEVSLAGDNTQLPPKDILFPCTEKMYSYKMGKDIEVKEIVNNPEQIVFGIRPCDVRSIECMDKVFLEKGFVDTFYSGKRDHVTIIAMGCTHAQDTCFCGSMGINPNEAPAADIMMHDSGENVILSSQTEKGEKVLVLLGPLLSKETGEFTPVKTECSLKTPMSEEIPKKLKEMFDHPIWEEAGRACMGCATCTYVCPTCYCFDIGSENHGAEGTKFRCWDSCMFSDYTRMAGGHNPRPSKKERVRNRYMHKLSYFNERYGTNLCVGCGRCVDKCPAHMDITEFINKVSEVE